MTLRIPVSRLTILVVGMAMLASAILCGAVASSRAGRDVRLRFQKVRAEGAHTPGRLRDAILEMRSILVTYEVTGEASYLEEFKARREQLAIWLETTKSSLASEDERAVFEKIDAAYAKYLADTAAVVSTRPAPETEPVPMARIKQIENASAPLLTLGSELSAARRYALGNFVDESEHSIVRLQQLIFASLLALVAFAAWSVRVLYREMISPLRVRLVETRELAERQEKLASLGVLAAGVAHEIRNPLTAIKARLYTQQKSLPPGSPAHYDATFIGQEIDRLARIISEFLAFARPPEPLLEAVDPAVLLGNVRDLLAPQLASNSIQIVVQPCPGVRIEGDPHQLQQVLINLVQNAAESIGSGGAVTLRARSAEQALGGELRKVVVLEVEDTGRGIPQEVQERLFDPFFTTKDSGTGLGLSIAARIVQKHGGALQYRTQVDRGSCFGVVLPSRRDSQP